LQNQLFKQLNEQKEKWTEKKKIRRMSRILLFISDLAGRSRLFGGFDHFFCIFQRRFRGFSAQEPCDLPVLPPSSSLVTFVVVFSFSTIFSIR